MVDWGKRIIEGERRRTSQGGVPIYNPTIAKVKVHYDIFVDSYEKQRALQALTNRSLEELSSMRARADELILDIWNQVEEKFQNVFPNEARLDKCRDYGLIYYYRVLLIFLCPISIVPRLNLCFRCVRLTKNFVSR